MGSACSPRTGIQEAPRASGARPASVLQSQVCVLGGGRIGGTHRTAPSEASLSDRGRSLLGGALAPPWAAFFHRWQVPWGGEEGGSKEEDEEEDESLSWFLSSSH